MKLTNLQINWARKKKEDSSFYIRNESEDIATDNLEIRIIRDTTNNGTLKN